VKREGSLSFLVRTIGNVLVMEIGWTDVGSGGYILVSCAHSNTSFSHCCYIYICYISKCFTHIFFVIAATNLWRTKMAKIAKDFKNISFAIANEEDYKNVIQEFGLEDSPEEINIGCFGLDGKKYPMEPMEEFDSEEIVEFLTKLKKGLYEIVDFLNKLKKKKELLTKLKKVRILN
jgi:hypothetical protein